MYIPTAPHKTPFIGPSYDHAMHDTSCTHSRQTLIRTCPPRTSTYKNQISLENPKLNGGSTKAFVEAKTMLARVCKVTLTVQSPEGRDLV